MAAPAEEQMSMMLEGGGLKDQGGTVDPISGNEVPDGATQEGVRDDVPAMLSEGEYVMNEASTRYHGVDKLNAMQEEAKQGYNQMEKDGLMGQPTQGAMLDDAIPFGMGDINVEDDQGQELMMADGGLVPKGFYHGGMHDERGRPIQATSGMRTLNTQNQPNRPQPSFGDSMGGFGGFTFKNYQHPDGRNMMVPFMNGVPMFSIPEGFVPFDLNDPDAVPPTPVVDPTVTPAEVVKPVEFGGGPDDPESGRPAGYNTMTNAEILAYDKLMSSNPLTDWVDKGNRKNQVRMAQDRILMADEKKMSYLNLTPQVQQGIKAEEKLAAEKLEEQNRLDKIADAKLAQIAAEKKAADKKAADKKAEEESRLAADKLAAEKRAADKLAKEKADKQAEADAISYTLEQPDGGTSYTAPSTPTGGTAGYSGNYNEPGRGDGPGDFSDGSGGVSGGGYGGDYGGGYGGGAGEAGRGGSPSFGFDGFSMNKGGLAGKKPKKKMKTYKKGGLATR